MIQLPTVQGGYRAIVTDNPWRFRDRAHRLAPDQDRGDAVRHYRTMTVEQLIAMGPEVRRVAARDCLLAMWAPRTHIAEGTAQEVARAWGFRPVTIDAWVKLAAPPPLPATWKRALAQGLRLGVDDPQRITQSLALMARQFYWRPRLRIGGGHYSRSAHEEVLLCVRGHPKVRNHDVPSVCFGERTGHSAKPEEYLDHVERMVDGPYLEMFSRRRRAGWDGWGDEYPQILLPEVTQTARENWDRVVLPTWKELMESDVPLHLY